VVIVVTIVTAVTTMTCLTKATHIFLIVIFTRKPQNYFSAPIFSIMFKFVSANTVLFLVMSDITKITAVFNNSCVCCGSCV
jgi:hypothetical protein